MKENIEQRMMALFGLVAALLILVAVVALNNVRQGEVTSDWVNHTHAVILETEAIQTSLHTAEGALRSYILTSDDRDQAAYREAFTETKEHLDVAKSLTKGDQRQQQVLGEIETLIGKRVDYARKIVIARKQSFDEAKQLVSSDAADQTLREIRKLVDRLKEDEAGLLQTRDRENFLQAQSTRWTVYVAAILNAAVIALIFWLIRDDLKSRRLVAATLQQANEQLEQKVKERTAELAKSNESLTLENLERKWSQSILERQFRHFEQILHSIGDSIFVISRTGRIIRVNPPATKLSGYSVNELIGESLAKVLQPETASTESPFVHALKEGRDLVSLPAAIKSRDGRTLKVVARAFPVRDNDKVVGSVVVCTQV